ncbi:serine hydrolase [Streptococcus sp. DD12]|uniref:serine hydrolase n=1 Tax=Streptococcus sp. DD12 TaxID=1777880 RepID=UPI0007938EE5|nr:serine hydrolase [Streptococcus sp. DD12]KXT76120.1 hypothetical protein STRDD12_01232 [Streptococcus sp. DD12]
MKKVALLFLLVMMSAPTLTYQSDSTQKRTNASAQAEVLSYFSQVPQNPLVLTPLVSYEDSNLTKANGQVSQGQTLSIQDLLINEAGQAVFQLTSGSYILASQKAISNDVPQNETLVDYEAWTPANLTVYDSPLTSQSQPLAKTVPAYSKVHVVKTAQTQAGTFSQIENLGWVRSSDLSQTDNRMEKVQALLLQKYNKSNYSIYVKQLDTQKEAGINADTEMYSASISKLPILYYVQREINLNKTTLGTGYKYTDAVNQFDGAYDPSGSGDLPKTADNKTYSLNDLVAAVTTNSDNVASNMLAYYVTDQFGNDFQDSLKALSITWDMKSRVVSSKTAGLMMEALYDQGGTVLADLTHTNFDTTRIAKNIPVQVAHKIGDAYDYKHDVAVVYADSPFILSIFTDDASYEDITAIADDVYAILK